MNLETEREKEIIYQQILEKQQALKKAWEAEEKNYLMGKFDPSARGDFVPVPEEYNVSGYKTYLRKETLEAFLKMREAASLSGVELNIASATRNFNYQKKLWNDKWSIKDNFDGLEKFKEILEWSAAPGTSRHHFGTDIDINNVNPPYFDSQKGEKEYNWLVTNASQFGFCQTYNLKGNNRPTGYNEEKWHWSYLPLARNFTQEYKDLITEEDIKGFLGDEYVAGQNLINNYVLSINSECL